MQDPIFGRASYLGQIVNHMLELVYASTKVYERQRDHSFWRRSPDSYNPCFRLSNPSYYQIIFRRPYKNDTKQIMAPCKAQP